MQTTEVGVEALPAVVTGCFAVVQCESGLDILLLCRREICLGAVMAEEDPYGWTASEASSDVRVWSL